jgi:hypothetical protein
MARRRPLRTPPVDCRCDRSGADGCPPTPFEPGALRLRAIDLVPADRSCEELRCSGVTRFPFAPAAAIDATAPSSIAALITDNQEVPHA